MPSPADAGLDDHFARSSADCITTTSGSDLRQRQGVERRRDRTSRASGTRATATGRSVANTVASTALSVLQVELRTASRRHEMHQGEKEGALGSKPALFLHPGPHGGFVHQLVLKRIGLHQV